MTVSSLQNVVDKNDCPNCGVQVYQAEALLAGESIT